jgi:hypothetical protein
MVLLLSMIKEYCCQFDTLIYDYMLIIEASKNLLYLFQKPTQTNSDHHEHFMAMVGHQRVWRGWLVDVLTQHD